MVGAGGGALRLGKQRCRGGLWGAGMEAGGSSSSSDRRIESSQRLRQRQRQRQQQTAAWPLLVSAGDAGSDENVAGSDGEAEGEVDGDGDGEGLLLFGGLESDDGGDDGDDEERGEVVEVDEEDLREDWIARGLNPEAFDPFVLLQMWEEEDEQVDLFVCVYHVCVPVSVSVCSLCVCACVHVCMYVSTCLWCVFCVLACVFLSVSASDCMFACVCMHRCLFVCMSVSCVLSVCVLVCPCTWYMYVCCVWRDLRIYLPTFRWEPREIGREHTNLTLRPVFVC